MNINKEAKKTNSLSVRLSDEALANYNQMTNTTSISLPSLVRMLLEDTYHLFLSQNKTLHVPLTVIQTTSRKLGKHQG